MRVLCHRCHSDLPTPEAMGGSVYDAPALFCPHCGAPQLRLAESARAAQPVAAELSTGSAPPPHPGSINWPVAVQAALPVALVAAVLKLIAFGSVPVALVSDVWIAFASLATLGLYARRLPHARLSSRAGLRIGLLTGTLTIAAIGLLLAGAGIVLRFGLHDGAVIDATMASAVAAMHQGVATMSAQQPTPPEVQAGAVLAFLAIRALFVLLFTAAGGALAGSMSHRRTAVARPSR
jgi:hypothetical protein